MKRGFSKYLLCILVISILLSSSAFAVGQLTSENSASEVKCSEFSVANCLDYDECEIKKFTQIYLVIFKTQKEKCTKKPIPVCGNDIVEGDEECDETDFARYTGACDEYSSSFSSGSLQCTSSCEIDITDCESTSTTTQTTTASGGTSQEYKSVKWTCTNGYSDTEKGDCQDSDYWIGYTRGFCKAKCSGCGVESFTLSSKCESDQKPVCGDGICETGETITSCPKDCEIEITGCDADLCEKYVCCSGSQCNLMGWPKQCEDCTNDICTKSTGILKIKRIDDNSNLISGTVAEVVGVGVETSNDPSDGKTKFTNLVL